MKNKINITKSFLPPVEDYYEYIKGIWERNQLTNNGPLVKQLEQELIDYLGVKKLSLIANGTIALQIAIKALDLHGEIITTPFSYVATTSSIIWEGCKPVFVDIDVESLCINPDLIEEAITTRTTAILSTHVYGIPCNVEKIDAIAKKHNIKVIYDGAHAFGVQYKGKSLLTYGDISILSFHATKVFHTVEGGAVITKNDKIAGKTNYMRNFGHKDEEDYYGLGINGKLSELHAAVGLAILPHVDEIMILRKEVCDQYDTLLHNSDLKRPTLPGDTNYNYAYYPIIFPSEESLLATRGALNKNNIYPRRYFYPSLNNLPYSEGPKMKWSEDISKRILCLPLYSDLDMSIITKIAEIIKENV